MFETLNDEELLVTCKSQVLIEKSATAKVLDVLIEIDHRRLWIKEGFSSMHDFCIRYLGYSESEANRRIQAARLTQKVEEVKPLLAQGELSSSEIRLLIVQRSKFYKDPRTDGRDLRIFFVLIARVD